LEEEKMGNPTIFDQIREWVAGIAWRVFLWAIRMTAEQYDQAVHEGCKPVEEDK